MVEEATPDWGNPMPIIRDFWPAIWAGRIGHGYAHILANVVPLMRRKGFREEDISAILVDTPRRILAFQ